MINAQQGGQQPPPDPEPKGLRAWRRRWRLWWRYRLRLLKRGPRGRRFRAVREPEDTGAVAARAQLRAGRLLGRWYLRALDMRERARIERALVPDRVEPGRVIAALVRQQKGLLLTLLALIVVGLGVDVLLHECAHSVESSVGIRHWLVSNISLPDADGLRVLLAATAGATGTILGIVLSISLIVFQTTAERYGSARIVAFLLRERLGSAIVRLLALGFAYSLWVLIVVEAVSVARPPYFSTAIAVGMSVAGVLALITYRTQALLGYLPSSIARTLVAEMLRELARARRRGSGRSVQRHAREVANEDMRTQMDLLRRLISPDRDPLGVASLVYALDQFLGLYLRFKPSFASDSEWWEREPVRADSPLTRMTEQLATQGLMDPTSQQPNRQWLEQKLLNTVAEVVRSEILQESDVRDATLLLLTNAMQLAFHMQEIESCKEALASLRELASTETALNDTALAEGLTQVSWLLLNLLDTGLSFSAERVVAAEPWKHPVDRLELRYLEREEARTIAGKIRREIEISGGTVTPRDAMVAEVDKSFQPKRLEIEGWIREEAYRWLEERLRATTEARASTSGISAKLALRALLRAVYKNLPLRLPQDFPRLLYNAFELETDSRIRTDLREDSALLARNLAEAERWDECWPVVRAAMLLAGLSERDEPHAMRRAELGFDALMTLAYVHACAEFAEETDHVEQLAEYLEPPWRNLDPLITMVDVEHFSTTLSLPFVTGVKYQKWFQPLLAAVRELPPRFEQRSGVPFPVERGKEHPSTLFRDWSDMLGGYDECLVHLVESCAARRTRARLRLIEALREYARMRGAES